MNGTESNVSEMLEKELALQNANPFRELNRVIPVAVGKDFAEVRLDIEPESLNCRGTVHGGAYFTMADVCSGMVSRTDGRTYVTQQANVQYVRAVKGGRLTGRGTVIHRGRTSCLVEVRITTEEDKLAFLGTFMFHCLG